MWIIQVLWVVYSLMNTTNNNPASIKTLAQHWPNVNPYVGPTSAHQRWANMDLSIGPTLARQRWRATLCQQRPNVGTLTLGQHWHNVTPMVVCQRCTNIGPTEAALLAFCEGNPSVTDGFPSQRARNAGVDVCLNNRLNKQSSWVTGDLRHQCDRRQCDIHLSKDVTVLFRRCTDWSKHNVQKDNGLSLAGTKPLSKPTLLYIVNYADPVYGVATICHQVRWLRWGHPSLFHTTISPLIWYEMFCVRDISYKRIWMEFINMFSVYAQFGTHSHFNW